MKHFAFIITLTFTVLSFLHTSCAPTNTEESKEELAKKSYVEKQVVKVSSEEVQLGNFSRELISNGKLSANEKAIVPFMIQEQVSKVLVKEGQMVIKGQLLAQLDPFTYQKRKQDAQNTYNKALIDLEDLLLGYGYSVEDSATIPENILKMCHIRSGLNTATSALEEAKRDLSHTQITAPISGVVCNLQARENNHSSEYDYCCQILDNSSMLVEFHILEGELGMVAKGQKVEAVPFALPQVSKTGIIQSVNPTVENGLVKVTALLPNSKGELMDGMSVKLLVKDEVPNCIIIPKSAVLYRQNRKVVFVHKKGLAIWTYVETGMENSTQVCITDKSLKVGDEVIVSNNLNLAHESPVTIE
jgi:multidrug efflux pump subunit AcrA (membrane-fusion protein)